MSIECMQVVLDVMVAHSADSRPAEVTSITPQFHDSSREIEWSGIEPGRLGDGKYKKPGNEQPT